MNSMKDKNGKIFWGCFLVLAAVFLIVGKMGFLKGIGLWTILFALFWVAVLIRGLIRIEFGQILFSIACLCIIFDEQLGIEALTPWTVLAAAFLGTIGLNMLFHKRWHRFHHEKYFEASFTEGERPEGSPEGDGGPVFCKASFGSAVKYVSSEDFQYAVLECSFGGMKVYFDSAQIKGASATVELDVSFGGVEMYVPKEWNVVNNARAFFGGIDEKGRNMSTGTPSLILTGEVNFAGVTVHYI